jgi:arylsulfatase A-like enzyme
MRRIVLFLVRIRVATIVAVAASAAGQLGATTETKVAVSADAASTLSAQAQQPNIIFIVADDLGYADVDSHGRSKIPTPFIDSIAKEGVRFTSGYVTAPVCSPSRAGLLTGRYQSRFGHELNPGAENRRRTDFGLPLSEITLPSRLKEAGYVTGMYGKWHLGMEPSFHPQKRGFDEFYGFLGGGHDYFKPGVEQGGNVIQHNGTPVSQLSYLTDDLAQKAAEFVGRQAEAGKPFFVYLPFNAVHTPLQAPEKYMARFPQINDRRERTHAAMLSAMDDGVGIVLKALEDNDITSNTLVFFISDNGSPARGKTSKNLPLRGFKHDLLEGGIRVPFLAKWPAKIPAGKVYDQPVISLDMYAMALAAAGTTAPASLMDGVDLVPYLDGSVASDPHPALYWRHGDEWGVRSGDWKLLQTGKAGAAPALYNLKSDIGETEDKAAANPDKARELKGLFDAWNRQLIEPLWAHGGKNRNNAEKVDVSSTTGTTQRVLKGRKRSKNAAGESPQRRQKGGQKARQRGRAVPDA